MTRLSFSLSFDTNGEKSLSPGEEVDVLFRIAQVHGVDDHVNIGAVLAAHLAARNVDHFDTMGMKLAYRASIVAPVAVGTLEHDAAFLQQALEHQVDAKVLVPHVAHTEREILEIHEYRYEWFI